MQLSSTTILKSRATSLIDNYASYVLTTLRDTLDVTTDTVAAQLRAVSGRVEAREGIAAFLAEAQSISSDEGFSTLPVPVQEDVTKIVEEVPLGIEHIDNITHPDTLFAALTTEKKHAATERATVASNSIGILRDLLHFDARANRAPGEPPSIPTQSLQNP